MIVGRSVIIVELGFTERSTVVKVPLASSVFQALMTRQLAQSSLNTSRGCLSATR